MHFFASAAFILEFFMVLQVASHAPPTAPPPRFPPDYFSCLVEYKSPPCGSLPALFRAMAASRGKADTYFRNPPEVKAFSHLSQAPVAYFAYPRCPSKPPPLKISMSRTTVTSNDCQSISQSGVKETSRLYGNSLNHLGDF